MNDRKTVLYDLIRSMAHDKLARLIAQCEGAFYLVSPSTVTNNVTRLTAALRANYKRSSVAYSYKTNYNGILVDSARKAGALSEVVSFDEFTYALDQGVEPSEIIFNGVGKSEKLLADVLTKPVTLIVDSVEELELCARVNSQVEIRARLGLRVSPVLSFLRSRSRFGIDFQDSAQMAIVQKLLSDSGLAVSGLHMHHSSARSAESFVERLNMLVSTSAEIGIKSLDFIDLGGGMASGMPEDLQRKISYPIDTLEQYGVALSLAMSEIFPHGIPELIVEPGTGVLADAGVYVTPVLSCKSVGSKSCAVVDGTIFTVDPLRSSVPPLIDRVGASVDSDCGKLAVTSPVEIGGNSCMETDVIHPSFDKSLRTGDILVVAQKGAYASCMATPFIQGIPALVSISDAGQFTRLRKRTDSGMLSLLNSSNEADSIDLGCVE